MMGNGSLLAITPVLLLITCCAVDTVRACAPNLTPVVEDDDESNEVAVEDTTAAAADATTAASVDRPPIFFPSNAASLLRDIGFRLLAQNGQAGGQDGGGPPASSCCSDDAITDGGAMSCDFAQDDYCCWRDGGTTDDSPQWRLAKQDIGDQQFRRTFAGAPSPEDSFLVTGMVDANGEARLVSCLIECSASVRVTLRHWTAGGASVFVCSVQDVELQDCVNVDASRQPGPTTVTLPRQRNQFKIEIITTTEVIGNELPIAIVDDIQVELDSASAEQCGDTTTTTAKATTTTTTTANRKATTTRTTTQPAQTGNELCNTIQCRGPACKSLDASDNAASPLFPLVNQPFDVASGQYHNRLTGVKKATSTDSELYLAAYLRPTDVAGLDSGPISLPGDRVLRLSIYEAVHNINLKVCFNELRNCVNVTDVSVSPTARSWHEHSVRIPADASRMMLLAENVGRNEGGLGVHDLQLMLPNGPDPAAAFEPAC